MSWVILCHFCGPGFRTRKWTPLLLPGQHVVQISGPCSGPHFGAGNLFSFVVLLGLWFGIAPNLGLSSGPVSGAGKRA